MRVHPECLQEWVACARQEYDLKRNWDSVCEKAVVPDRFGCFESWA
jgi:hypothetical protein